MGKNTYEKGEPGSEALKAAVDSDDVEKLKAFAIDTTTVVTVCFEESTQTYDPDEGTYWVSGKTIRYNHMPILFYAAKEGKIAIVTHLLAQGFKPDVIPPSASVVDDANLCVTPLLVVTRNAEKAPNSPEIMKILLDKGAAVDAKDGKGRTALTVALMNNNIDKAQLLLDHGANINFDSVHKEMRHLAYGALGSGTSYIEEAFSPIHLAHAKTISWCVEHGADIEAVELVQSHFDSKGAAQYTPLLNAVRNKWNMERVRELLKAKANFYARSDSGLNVFDLLAPEAPSDIVNELVLRYFRSIYSKQATEAKVALRPGTKAKFTPKA